MGGQITTPVRLLATATGRRRGAQPRRAATSGSSFFSDFFLVMQRELVL
jgi:hypothetical protein